MFNLHIYICQGGSPVLPRNGINSMWILKNSKDLLEKIYVEDIVQLDLLIAVYYIDAVLLLNNFSFGVLLHSIYPKRILQTVESASYLNLHRTLTLPLHLVHFPSVLWSPTFSFTFVTLYVCSTSLDYIFPLEFWFS